MTQPRPLSTIFLAFLRLGLTSFGGPVAHIAYFQQTFVEEKQWLSARAYAELVAICQFLPGPASSQVGFGIGLQQAGLRGALTAWLAFTLPSAMIMIGLGASLVALNPDMLEGVVRALKAATVGVVFWAVWSMAKQLTPDWQRGLIGLFAMVVALGLPWWLGWSIGGQIAAIALGAIIALYFMPVPNNAAESGFSVKVSRRTAIIAVSVFLALLILLPLLALLYQPIWLQIADAMYRSGALVFGGGHVVLPLLHAETVAQGMLDEDHFLAGYGAAQALPGPLFAFGGFVGAATAGIMIGILAVTLIFLPGCLLLVTVLPFWADVRNNQKIRRALVGVNAAVVGILASALIDPVIRVGINDGWDLLLATGMVLGLATGKVPVWALVLAAGGLGLIVF